MRSYYWLHRGAKRFAPLLLLFVLLAALFVLPGRANADGGVAISGSFSGQVFDLVQGSSVNVSSLYVAVFNTGNVSKNVRMSVDAPAGVLVNLSETDFVLPAGGEQQVMVVIKATADASPGDHEVDITAEPYIANPEGIQVVGAAGVSATVRIVGQGGNVTVNLVNADSAPIIGEVRLYRVISGKEYEVARSMTGSLSMVVAPGSFYAVAYAGEDELANASFDVAANQNKVINLVGRTIYFAGFDPVPYYSKDTGLLHHLNMVYTVENLYQPVSDIEFFMLVSRDGTQLERTSIFSMPKLDLGSFGMSYNNYVPADGWVDGSYSFQLQLYIGNKLFTTTLAKSFNVSGDSVNPTATPAGGGGGNSSAGVSAGMIIGIVVAVVIAGAVLTYFILKRRKK